MLRKEIVCSGGDGGRTAEIRPFDETQASTVGKVDRGNATGGNAAPGNEIDGNPIGGNGDCRLRRQISASYERKVEGCENFR